MKINIRHIEVLAVIATACVVTACSDKASPETPETNMTEYEIIEPAVTNPKAHFTDTEMSALGQNGVAFRLYEAALSGDVTENAANGNFNISPASAVVGLTLVANSIDEPARSEIATELGYEGIDMLNNTTGKLLSYLPADGLGVVIKMANSIWVNSEYTCSGDFVNAMRRTFYSPVTSLNMIDEINALRIINSWCEMSTEGMIKRVLENITPGCVAIWANALYFNGTWKDKFDKSLTSESTFHGRDGESMVAMMHANRPCFYSASGRMEMVSIDFDGMNYCLDIISDEKGELTKESYSELLSKAKTFQVDLGLPRFEVNTSVDLTAIFKNLPSIFSKGTFATMGLPMMAPVTASKSIQKTAIKVNEDGAEAAAVTITDLDTSIFGPDEYGKVKVTFDSPFTYIIREKRNGIILFIGRVENL